MGKSRVAGLGIAAFAVLLVVYASDAAAQSDPMQMKNGQLSLLAPANLAKPRPKPPFDLTGYWIHVNGEPERYTPPPDLKLLPPVLASIAAAKKAHDEGKVYHNDIGLCWPSGLPIMMTRVWPVAMMQYPTGIFMVSGLMDSFRIVFMDGRKHTDPDIAIASFNGESIGHWEGDALVIDTTNFVGDHHWINDTGGVPVSDQFHEIERITMSPDKMTLTSDNTFIDPKGWVGEWHQSKHFKRVDNRDIGEVECYPDLDQHMPSTSSKDNVRD